MRETEFFFDDGTAFRPVNADIKNGGIGFKMDWTGDPKEAELNVDALLLVGSAKKKVEEHIDSLGFFEGMPITIKMGGLSLDYYIDFVDNFVRTDSSFQVKIKRRKAIDSLFSNADGTSFELIAKEVGIANMFNVPYVIVQDDQVLKLIMLGLVTFSLAKELIQGIKDTQDLIADIAATLPPVPGNIGAIVAAAIKLAAQLVYVFLMLVALINLITQILELIFPKKRNFRASYVRELVKQGVEYLGYTLSSELLDEYSQLTIVPVPLQDDNPSIFKELLNIQTQSYTKGYPTANDTTPTVGSLIRAIERWLNAKTRIINGVVHIERRDHWFDNSGVTITNTLNLQDVKENSHTYNFAEAWKRYYLHYQTDISDLHTMDNIKGLHAEYSTEPVTFQNLDLLNIKGLVNIAVPFALGVRKDVLNFVEKIALALAEFADFVINALGGESNLAGIIEGRIGVLQISQQNYRTSKMLWTVGGKQPEQYLDKIGAKAICEALHKSNRVKENFKRVYTATVPFSDKNFVNLLNHNVVVDQDDNELELLDADFVNEASAATITYTIDSTEASNVKTILVNA